MSNDYLEKDSYVLMLEMVEVIIISCYFVKIISNIVVFDGGLLVKLLDWIREEIYLCSLECLLNILNRIQDFIKM